MVKSFKKPNTHRFKAEVTFYFENLKALENKNAIKTLSVYFALKNNL